MSEEQEKFDIVCVFCNAIWTAEMKVKFDYISNGCPSCGDGATAVGTATITCSNCNRVIYKKEFEAEGGEEI